MKKVVLFLVFGTFIYSQSPKLSLPPNYIRINPLPVTPFALPTFPGGYQGISTPTFYCHNSMIDAGNNIKFFIVDNKIYNAAGGLFGTGFLFNNINDVTGSQEVCIVPDPANCSKYYIISSVSPQLGGFNSDWYPCYSVIDLASNTLTNFGGITAFDLTTLIPNTPATAWGEDGNTNFFHTRVGIAATKQKSDGSYLVFIHDGIRHIYRFKITTSGIFYETMIDIVPIGFEDEYDQWSRAEMEIIDIGGGNYRLATVYTAGIQLAEFLIAQPTVYFTDLDPNGNLIGGTQHYVPFYTPWEVGPPPNYPIIPYPTSIHGLEFSPGGQYLYISHQRVDFPGGTPYPLEYIDCLAASPDHLAIANQADATPYQFSQLELGLDGNIYATDGANLISLSLPDFPNPTNWSFSSPIPVNYSYTDELSGYTNLKTYTLPDQIDGLNYSDQFNTVQCCVANQTYNATTFTATSGNWTTVAGGNPLNGGGTNAYIQNKLIIPPGVTVTITGMNIYFAPGASLEIQSNGILAGGRLILKGTKLSVDTRCGDLMWNGVELQGAGSSFRQTPYLSSKHGKIEVLDNAGVPSVIEYALKGITASKITSVVFDPSDINPHDPIGPHYEFTMTPNTGGGIIKARNSMFRNNWFDIDMRQYVYGTDPNRSYFTNCTFFTDISANPIPLNSTVTGYPKYPLYHVYLNNLKNISFIGCDFKNDYANDLSNQTTLGWGIRSIDAQITVQSNCSSVLCPPGTWDNTNFKNLEYGIFTTNSLPSRTVSCTDANFKNNRYGILLRNVYAARVLKNNFDIYKAVSPNSTAGVFGLYLQNCDQYSVQENIFQENPIIPTVSVSSYGVVVNSSGTANNEIYKNTFQNLYIGGQSQGINGGAVGTGLRWKCNTFNDQIGFGGNQRTNRLRSGFMFRFRDSCRKSF